MKSKTILRSAAFFGAALLLSASLFWLKISTETRAAAPVAPNFFPEKTVEMAAEIIGSTRL